jgi:hypothetical protein
MHRLTTTSAVAVCAALASAACTDSAATSPSPTRSTRNIVLLNASPPPGSTIPMTQNGSAFFILPRNGALSLTFSIVAHREVPWAQLYVYLLTNDSRDTYCGQNLPDVPSWGPFPAFDPVTVSITGFEMFRSSCDVTGVRAMLHLRDNGSLIPPAPSQTIAEGIFTVRYHLQR